MNRIRLLITANLLLSILFLAHSQVASANKPSEQNISAADKQPQSIVPDRDDDDCDKEKEKQKEKCKPKGTVKPPPKEIVITVTGKYSVGGFCTLTVELYKPEIKLEAGIHHPLPRQLPDGLHQVGQGCLLTYYRSNQRIDELPPVSGKTTICFAAIPKKEMIIYFYDLYAENPAWVPIETTVKDGLACAAGNESGLYIATFQKP